MIIPSESVATDMILSKEQLKTIIHENFLVEETFQKEILVEDYLSVDDYLMKNGEISKMNSEISNINSEISKINRRSNIPPKHPKTLSPVKIPTVKIVKLKQKFDKNMCYLCKVKFSRPDNLKRHKYSVHFGQNFPCEVCGKTFSRQDKLKVHKCQGEKVKQ